MPAADAGIPLGFEELSAAGSLLGSGGLIVMDQKTCMVDMAKYFLAFLEEESCGRCVPCREGVKRMREVVEGISIATGTEEDIGLSTNSPSASPQPRSAICWLVLLFLPLLCLWGSSCTLASHTHRDAAPLKAILVVAFGTSVPEAPQAYDRIDAQARKAFPDAESRWAFTSRTIRAKLAGEGRHLNSPEVSLARMMSDGYTRVAVLSLHVIPGEEFHDLHRNAQLFAGMAGGFERILVAPPLLSSHEDMLRVARGLLKQGQILLYPRPPSIDRVQPAVPHPDHDGDHATRERHRRLIRSGPIPENCSIQNGSFVAKIEGGGRPG